MAKKNKGNKFSKTRLRPKTKTRASIQDIRKNRPVVSLEVGKALNYLNDFGVKYEPSANTAPALVFDRRDKEDKIGMLLYHTDSPLGNDAIPALHLDLTNYASYGKNDDLNDSIRALMEKGKAKPEEVTITVSAKEEDKNDVRFQLEQMVADMNEEARGDDTKQQYILEQLSIEPWALKQGIANIQFRLKPVAAGDSSVLAPVMSAGELQEGLGQQDEKAIRKLVTYLKIYHDTMNASTRDTYQGQIDAMNVKHGLLKEIESYLQQQKKDSKKRNVAERLKLQISDDPRLRQLNKVMDVAYSRDGNELGKGSKGAIYSRIFHDNFEAAVKLDSRESTEPAVAAGIPKDNPQESLRAVTAYEVDKLLGLGVIPETRFVAQTDKDGVKLGSAMQVVHGFVGQRFRRARQLTPKDIDDIKQNGNVFYEKGKEIRSNDQYEVILDNSNPPQITEMYKLEPAVVDVNYHGGNLQKGLSNLQLLDNIIGAADRHPGNWIYISNGPQAEITSVQGIDNDDAHGQNWRPKTSSTGVQSKTPPVPPIIDIDTAIKVLEADKGTLKSLLNLLPLQDAEAELERFDKVREAILQRINEGMIASDDGKVTEEQIQKLNAKGAQIPVKLTNIYKWGDDKVVNEHKEGNSYLGLVITMKDYKNKKGDHVRLTDAVFK